MIPPVIGILPQVTDVGCDKFTPGYSEQSPFLLICHGVSSMSYYFKTDKSHKVGSISQTGNELDSGKEFCIDDILDGRL